MGLSNEHEVAVEDNTVSMVDILQKFIDNGPKSPMTLSEIDKEGAVDAEYIERLVSRSNFLKKVDPLTDGGDSAYLITLKGEYALEKAIGIDHIVTEGEAMIEIMKAAKDNGGSHIPQIEYISQERQDSLVKFLIDDNCLTANENGSGEVCITNVGCSKLEKKLSLIEEDSSDYTAPEYSNADIA